VEGPALDRDDLPREPLGGAGEPLEPPRQPLHLTGHLSQELAVVAGLDPRQAVRVTGDQRGEAAHRRGPREPVRGAPFAAQRRSRGGDGAVHVGGVRVGHLGPRLAAIRIDARVRGAGRRGGRRAADPQAVPLHHRHLRPN
jgi:hypothetical protein